MADIQKAAATDNNRETKTYRIVFWGWGWVWLHCLDAVNRLREKGQIEAAGITGDRLPPYAVLDGVPVIRPDEVQDLDPDYILVMNNVHEKEIREAILALGFTRDRILSWEIFEIPLFDFRKYAAIVERKISIISNDCWGGILSRSLRLEHRSPFKNLYLKDWDYLKCLNDLEHYCLEADPVFDRWQEGTEIDDYPEYPVLCLDDIDIYCNHDQDPDQAIEKWLRRRKKINMDDLFVEMRTGLKESEQQFEDLKQYPSRGCFVPYPSDMPHSCEVRKLREKHTWGKAVHENVMVGGGNVLFSMIDLLYSGKIVRRAEDRAEDGTEE